MCFYNMWLFIITKQTYCSISKANSNSIMYRNCSYDRCTDIKLDAFSLKFCFPSLVCVFVRQNYGCSKIVCVFFHFLFWMHMCFFTFQTSTNLQRSPKGECLPSTGWISFLDPQNTSQNCRHVDDFCTTKM